VSVGGQRSIRIGCSGWNYAHWRNGVFYPPRLAASKWLAYYAQHFDTVEVNATFYRLPRRSSSRLKFGGSCQRIGPSFGEPSSGSMHA
jgi:hypothetical protein